MTELIKFSKNVTLLFRWGSLWIGAHWSKQNQQWCINLVPCFTLRIRIPPKVTYLKQLPKDKCYCGADAILDGFCYTCGNKLDIMQGEKYHD